MASSLASAEPEIDALPRGCGRRTGSSDPDVLDPDRLEQKVRDGRASRDPDSAFVALLRTAVVVRSMVFAEIKQHRTELLADDYR
ncbi:hypothetical protein [Tessaracoccus sp. G1721]